MALKVNSLLTSDVEGEAVAVKEPPLLTIPQHPPVDQADIQQKSDSGSDSSYSERAKKTAEKLDLMIEDAKLDRIEKTNRITQARNQKARELEERQRSFKGGGHHNPSDRNKSTRPVPNPKSDRSGKNKSKTSANNRVQKAANDRNTPTTSRTTDSNKEDKRDAVANENTGSCRKHEKPHHSIVKNSGLPGKGAPDSDLSSKLRNITLQEFDIDSTDSSDYESDDSSNNLSDREQTKGRLKLFTTKNLNRGAFEIIDVDDDMASSENDSVDNGTEQSGASTARSYWSAEKSSAARKRKRSNYLKKRDFKNNQKSLEKGQHQSSLGESALKNHQLDAKSSFKHENSNSSNKESGVPTDATTNTYKTNKNVASKQTTTNYSQINQHISTENNIKHKGSKQFNHRTNETDATKPNVKFKKNAEKRSYLSNLSVKSPITSNENTAVERLKDNAPISQMKMMEYERKDKTYPNCSDRFNKNRSESWKSLKESKCIDDIVVVSEVYLNKKDSSKSDRAQGGTENVLDSILKTPSDDEELSSSDKRSALDSLTIDRTNSSSDSDDIDFNAILNERRKINESLATAICDSSDLNAVKAIRKSNKDDESSSDFEAELEACLATTKLKFSPNLNK